MSIEEGYFESRDGKRLFYRFQRGTGPEKPVFILHGHGEHSGRYLKFFSRLAGHEYPVAAFDLRGCGRSDGPPVYVSSFQDYLNDLTDYRRFLEAKGWVRGPLQLLGHSLGGLIAVFWARQNPAEVSKLVLSSPLFGLPLSGFLRALTHALNAVMPHYVIYNPVKPPFLTHDPEEVRKYKTDPLIRRRITVRLAHEMLKCISLLRQEALTFPFPVYVLMAGDDYVVDPEATKRLFHRLQAPRKELKVFEGLYHEIFNEKEQDKVFEIFRAYLRE